MKRSVPDDAWEWNGPLPAPDFSQLPDVAFDEIMRHLSGSEWKVLCWLMRETYGWHRPTVDLSLADIAEATGCSKSSAVDALKSLAARGLVAVDQHSDAEHGQTRNTYRLLVASDARYVTRTPVQKSDRPLPKTGQGRVRKTDSPSLDLYTEKGTETAQPKMDKYTRGAYGLCPRCKSNRHEPGCEYARGGNDGD